MTAKQFQAAIDRLGLTQVGAARLFGYDARTARRWKEADATPPAVSILLRLLLAKTITIEDVEAASK